PWPSLFGTEETRLREEDVVNRRRAWTWRFYFRLALWLGGIITIVFVYRYLTAPTGTTPSWPGTATHILRGIGHVLRTPQLWLQVVFVMFLFLANFLIFMGPMMLMGISQIRGYEPGDAEWGVKLEHVRGQAEAKEEVRRIVTLWQSGEAFERAGGKRERGLLFLGAPGTGKTMLAKAIATGFNSPFVSIPGSGFAQTFIGIDALIVRFLARKAKKLARKWGGQCIVVMDGIDNPPFMRRFVTNKINSFLDAVYVVPRRIGRVSLRLRPPRPLGAQIYFIGATNVPMDRLDPALTRPGRMGRHVWFRTPTKEDRKDIFELYLDRVAHDPDLDSSARRDESARITNGYSPAMIEQICSMALTNAHHSGKLEFDWKHLVDAMTAI